MNLCNTDTPQGLDGFGARLRIIRDIRNLTQQELADKSGLVAAHVSHFETGERLPSLENLRVLCRALNVSADYLIDSDECVTTQLNEMNAFVKHVGAPNFQEAVDVTLRKIDQDGALLEDMFTKLKELGAWKQSALAVMPDYQEIGKLLDVPPGASVHDKIVPGIKRLLSSRSTGRKDNTL